MLKPRTEVLIAMIVGAALLRLVPHPPNFAPIGAMALFGGAYLADRRLAFLVPLLALLLSDLFLGLYSHMEWVYGGFTLAVCIGLELRPHRRSAGWIGGATLLGSTLFFLITNFGIWLHSTRLYTKDLAGLAACYLAALPFFGNTLLGDGFYALVLFGGFALLEDRFAILRDTPGTGAT